MPKWNYDVPLSNSATNKTEKSLSYSFLVEKTLLIYGAFLSNSENEVW
jgi:hypothetical protein